MEKLTSDEIISIINSDEFSENKHGPEYWMYEDVYSHSCDIGDKDLKFKASFDKLGEFTCVDTYGGEGKGEEYWAIYYFKDHDVYIKFDGWYQSYHGAEFSNAFEVRPQEVTRTEYVKV